MGSGAAKSKRQGIFNDVSLSRRTFLALTASSACALALSGCSAPKQPKPTYTTYLDDSRLSLSGDRVVYTNKKGVVAKTGIDVSEFQGYINWNAVASDGISFVFVRLGNRGNTEGGLYPDSYAAYNIAAAKAAGLQVHGYFFSQALTEAEAVEEADYAVGIARDAGLTSGYIAFDLETEAGRTHGMAGEAMAAAAQAFCARVEQHGFKSLVYGNKIELLSFGAKTWDALPIWLAQYTYGNPESPCPFVLWQYASDGRVSGVDTVVDLNIWVEE